MKTAYLVITGRRIGKLMRAHKVTIAELSARMGITQKRIREVRSGRALLDEYCALDWVEAITGKRFAGPEGSIHDKAYVREWIDWAVA